MREPGVSLGSIGDRQDTDVQLARLRDVAQDPGIDPAVEVVREFLDMEVAYTTEMTTTSQTFVTLRGDGESFGVAEGTVMNVGDTYCQRVLDGRLPSIMPDVLGDPPHRLAADHRGRRSRRLVFARLISDQIERRDLEAARRGLEQRVVAADTLIAAVNARDSYTAEHSRQVVEHATAVARNLGLSGVETADVGQVALLHDIGKIGIADEILRKPGPLNDAEWDAMRRHPIISEQLIGEVKGLAHLGPSLRAEHEHWDGTGYPDGLAGEEIPIASRITFVCDAYDAMTTDRPYREALAPAVAREEIGRCAGTQFCPGSAAALLAVLEDD